MGNNLNTSMLNYSIKCEEQNLILVKSKKYSVHAMAKSLDNALYNLDQEIRIFKIRFK